MLGYERERLGQEPGLKLEDIICTTLRYPFEKRDFSALWGKFRVYMLTQKGAAVLMTCFKEETRDAQGRPIHTVVGYANPAQVMQDTKKAAEALNTQQSLTNKLAEKLTDQQRRDTLVQLLKTVPQSSIRTFYKPALAELEKLDPQDASGILAKLHRDDLLHAQKLEWADTFRKKNIHILADQNPDEALSIMDSYLKKNGLLPEVKQAVLMQKVYLLMQQNRVNELEQPLKEGVALLPESFEGKAFSKLLDKLPEIKKERGLLKPGEEPPLPPGAIRATKMIVPTAPAK